MNAEKCDHCGLCKENCPVFEDVRKEIVSPRSQLQYAAGNMQTAIAMNCTFCHACVLSCPYEIDIPSEIRKLRERMVQNGMETKAGKAMIENIRKYGNPYGEE